MVRVPPGFCVFSEVIFSLQRGSESTSEIPHPHPDPPVPCTSIHITFLAKSCHHPECLVPAAAVTCCSPSLYPTRLIHPNPVHPSPYPNQLPPVQLLCLFFPWLYREPGLSSLLSLPKRLRARPPGCVTVSNDPLLRPLVLLLPSTFRGCLPAPSCAPPPPTTPSPSSAYPYTQCPPFLP